MTEHRTKRISWPDEYMLQAIVASWRSPDPNTQVGAAIVDPERKTVIATGYNGWPRGISNCSLPWDREAEDRLDTKYPYVVHAEKNAIVNAVGSIEGFTLFSTMYPCNECSKDIIQAGITRVVYLDNPYEDVWFTQAAEKMFDILDIPTEQHEWFSTVTTKYLDSLSALIKSKL